MRLRFAGAASVVSSSAFAAVESAGLGRFLLEVDEDRGRFCFLLAGLDGRAAGVSVAW